MSHEKQATLQARHFKDPDTIKVSKNISMTEAQYAELHQAAKTVDMFLGDFINFLVKEFMAARVK